MKFFPLSSYQFNTKVGYSYDIETLFLVVILAVRPGIDKVHWK